jgi:cell shape-determining protein MreC
MTVSDEQHPGPRRGWAAWLRTPLGGAALLLVAAAVLHSMPARFTDPVRDAWMTFLRPTVAIADGAIDFTRDRVAWLQAALADGRRAAEAEQQAIELKARNDRLAAALDAARRFPVHTDAGMQSASSTAPLLQTNAVAARVLGQTAQSFLRGRELLDVGSRSGVAVGGLVLDSEAPIDKATSMIDAGRDLELQPGGVVLAGRRVWGKLASVGSHVSVVRRITDRGYRAEVQIVHGDADNEAPQRPSPRGMLVGTGDRLCRIELVDASEPVSVGDRVYSESDGALPEPLVYGEIVRVEEPRDKLHWQIWMQPAAGSEAPREVAVLRTELNPTRMGVASR